MLTKIFVICAIMAAFVNAAEMNTCGTPTGTRVLPSSTVNYTVCNFEVKYVVTPKVLGTPLNVSLPYLDPLTVNVACPNASVVTNHNSTSVPNNVFLHVAELVCFPDGTMEFDLYAPILHLRGTALNVPITVNGELMEITL